jgi:hypothetical protein
MHRKVVSLTRLAHVDVGGSVLLPAITPGKIPHVLFFDVFV